MVSWGRKSRDLLLFSRIVTTLLANAPSTRPGEGGQTGASSLNSELDVCFSQLSTFVTNCEQRKLSNFIGGGSLYGGRCALTTPALQDEPSPFGRLAGPLG